jgi:hypothetical protein
MKSHATHSNIRRTVLRCALILGVLAMLTTLLVIGTMQARYVEQAAGASTLVTPAFYFRSDLLSTGGESHTLNAGTTQLSVRLFNYADALRVAQTPITYTYELKETSTGTIKKTGNDTLGSGTPIAAAEAILTLDGLSAGQYELEVKSTAPYTTTLRGTFVIKSADTNLYYHVDTTPDAYVVLTIWTVDQAYSDVSVSYEDVKLILDPTQGTLTQHPTPNTLKSWTLPHALEKNNSCQFYFMKQAGYDPETQEIVVKDGGGNDAKPGVLGS